jgi:BMFP domain-containing protein YqiC
MDLDAPWRCVGSESQPVAARGIEMNEKLLGEIAARLAEAAASNPARDLEKNARAVLTAAFARLDLVTREEFDVQSEVLARARIRVAELEAKVTALEARFSSNNQGPS